MATEIETAAFAEAQAFVESERKWESVRIDASLSYLRLVNDEGDNADEKELEELNSDAIAGSNCGAIAGHEADKALARAGVLGLALIAELRIEREARPDDDALEARVALETSE